MFAEMHAFVNISGSQLELSPGDVYFDPVSFQFFYKNKAGETGSSYSLDEAQTKASG